MRNSTNKVVSGQDFSNDFADVKSRITLEQAEAWYSNKTGKKPKPQGGSVRFGAKGSLELSVKDGVVVWYDHETQENGSIIDLVMKVLECDTKKALKVCQDEILNLKCAPIKTVSTPTPQKVDTPVDNAALYADFMAKHQQALIDGMNSPAFEAMCAARGFNPDVVRGLQGIGYAAQKISYAKHNYIAANSFVFCDGVHIAALTLDARKGYHRRSKFELCKGDGKCVWMPSDAPFDGEYVFLTEGETSAMALICAGFRAIPCRPDTLTGERLEKLKTAQKIIIAYDNDKAGLTFTNKALKITPESLDISELWCGNGWSDGADPNDYVKKLGIDKAHETITVWLNSHETKQTSGCDELDPTNIDSIRQYFLNKSQSDVTEAERRAMADPVVGEFVRLLDPYRMRKHAPACVLVAWGIVRLSQYTIDAPSNPRIINLVSRSGAGKNWTLGTLRGSHSLYYQLSQDPNIDAYKTEDSSVTGNGLSLDAFYWATEETNQKKCRVGVWSEFGNAQTRGYGQEERAGSIGNYDVALCDGKIQKPRNKRDLKDLKEFNQEYPYNGCEIRAYQNINGAKVVVPRFRGSGEARREFWFFMSTPTDDAAFDDLTVAYADDALRKSAFMPDACDEAFNLLNTNALPFEPVSPYYEYEPVQRITTDATCESWFKAYQSILKTVTNSFYRANKCELLRDKLTFCAGLSAGLHGRTVANDDDYWIAAYICECLADSLDVIMDNAPSIDDPNSVKSKIVECVKNAGVKGKRADKMSYDKKAIDELCDKITTKDGVVFGDDAVIEYRIVKDGNQWRKLYFHKDFIKQAEKTNKDLQFPTR